MMDEPGFMIVCLIFLALAMFGRQLLELAQSSWKAGLATFCVGVIFCLFTFVVPYSGDIGPQGIGVLVLLFSFSIFIVALRRELHFTWKAWLAIGCLLMIPSLVAFGIFVSYPRQGGAAMTLGIVSMLFGTLGLSLCVLSLSQAIVEGWQRRK